MKKKNIINLIRYHVDKDERGFRHESYEIARELQNNGDGEIARYIMSLLSDANTLSSQEYFEEIPFFEKIINGSPMLKLPKTITTQLDGITTAITRGADIHKFIFYGESGTGKTEAAKILAKKIRREIYTVRFDRVVDSLLGQTSKNLVKVFDEINNLSHPERVVILFDELDAIALDRINSNDMREMGRVTTTFLNRIDELPKNVMVIATTNLFDRLDKAIVRRFDYSVNFDLYTKEDLVEIALAMFAEEIKKYPDLKVDAKTFEKIIRLAPKMPMPGDMKNAIRSAMAFSEVGDSYGYLRGVYNYFVDGKTAQDIRALKEKDFSIREIERLTGVPKSTVSRELRNERFTRT